MLTPKQKLELIADLLEYPEAERDLTGAPESLRKCANYIFELETKIQAQNETLNGVRMLLGIPNGKGLLFYVQKLIEKTQSTAPPVSDSKTPAEFPLERDEIKRRLDNLAILHKSKDSTRVLFNRLLRTLKDRGIIDDLLQEEEEPPISKKSFYSF